MGGLDSDRGKEGLTTLPEDERPRPGKIDVRAINKQRGRSSVSASPSEDAD